MAVFSFLCICPGAEAAERAGAGEGESRSDVWNAEWARTWTEQAWWYGAATSLYSMCHNGLLVLS